MTTYNHISNRVLGWTWLRGSDSKRQFTVVSHTWMSHVTHMNESCHTYEYTPGSEAATVNGSLQRFVPPWLPNERAARCRTMAPCSAVLTAGGREPRGSRSRVTQKTCAASTCRVIESCHTYEWVMSHIRMSHVTHMNESCHTYERVMSHIWMSHVTHMNESCHTYEW